MKVKPNYGLDAPNVIFKLSLMFILIVFIQVATDVFILKGKTTLKIVINIALSLSAISFLITTLNMFMSSLIFKIRNRDVVMDKLGITGDEKALDVGCGRGLYLIGVAKRLTTGHVTGIDIWNAEDLSKNNKSNTEKNIEIENVTDKVDLMTADMREMPFENESFDVVVSSFAIHNIYDKSEREKALNEINRVTKRHGRICLVDFVNIYEYKSVFEQCGFNDIRIERAKGVFPSAKVLYAVKQ